MIWQIIKALLLLFMILLMLGAVVYINMLAGEKWADIFKGDGRDD